MSAGRNDPADRLRPALPLPCTHSSSASPVRWSGRRLSSPWNRLAAKVHSLIPSVQLMHEAAAGPACLGLASKPHQCGFFCRSDPVGGETGTGWELGLGVHGRVSVSVERAS